MSASHDRLVQIIRSTFEHPVRSERAVTTANVAFLLAEVDRRTTESDQLRADNADLRKVGRSDSPAGRGELR